MRHLWSPWDLSKASSAFSIDLNLIGSKFDLIYFSVFFNAFIM